ncbi:phenylalanine--tRNA ligase subunit alpha [Patescibacteria group bacterium]|nr:phenylalanine--tRNA ligase subunit alpha [Patescibacteria group bacterium]
MRDQLQTFEQEALAALREVATLEALEAARVSFLGRKGRLAEMLADFGSLSPEERKTMGQLVNTTKATVEGAFTAAEARVRELAAAQATEREWLDITLPGSDSKVGHTHLTTQAIDEVMEIFSKLGFVRSRHPEVDWDYYAFESLNMPKEHPARDEWETFFIGEGGGLVTGEKGKMVLTPHTSNGQVREMEKGRLPIRMISIGKTYRRQATARHLPMFHQFEGLMIDEKVTITDLQGVFDFFVKRFFGEDRKTRLRPFHFRFTEPSFELDVSCSVCGGDGVLNGVKCKLCKGGWLELGGAGMVHPNVLKAGGLDPKKYQGFAFGWGVERTLMMRSGLNIDDIRIMYRNDLRFLKQF